jgi:hypothetical protein
MHITHTRTHTHTHARTFARAHTHTHTICMYMLHRLSLSWCVRGTLPMTSIITHLTLTCGDCRSRKSGMNFSAGSNFWGLHSGIPIGIPYTVEGRLGWADCVPRPHGSAYSSHYLQQSCLSALQCADFATGLWVRLNLSLSALSLHTVPACFFVFFVFFKKKSKIQPFVVLWLFCLF